jgi:MOSC domain-containing protein YiiM
MLSIAKLTSRFGQDGRLDWIGTRPGRNQPMEIHSCIEVLQKGLAGDRTVRPSNRSVTLIQSEHLPVIASLICANKIDPTLVRRNLLASGINLLALKDRHFSIGTIILLGTGICAPCSKMDKALGHGGYNAMRGHGGITASVLTADSIRIGDPVGPSMDHS